MASVNEKLLDRYIRHAVYIERFKAGEAKKISRHLSREVFPELIDKLMTKIKATDPSKLKKLWAIRRLRRLTASMDKIIKAGMIKAKDATVDSLMNLAEWEAKWNKGMIEKMVPLDIDMSMPNPEVLRQAVLTTPFEGHKLGTWFNAYSKSVRIGMMGAVKKGISAGEDIPSIGRRLRKVTSLKRMQAEYIARTAVSSVVNGAKEAVFLRNKNLVKEIQYVSTLDTRTTLICINLDGQIFVVGRGPRPPMHFNCRSTTIPVISSWKEFGIKAPPPATRASMTGKVPAKMTYKTWLRKQSKATQIKVLGKRRAELYRSGRVKIDRFVGKDYKSLTLKQLARREGLEFKPAPPMAVATTTRVGTTFAKTTTTDIRKVVDETIDIYPEKAKLALNRRGVTYNIGNSLTEINPVLKGKHPVGWSEGTTWDNVSGVYDMKTRTVSVAETYLPKGKKFFVVNSKNHIRRVLNHETGHAFDSTFSEIGVYSNTPKFQQAYQKDILKLSEVGIAKNDLRFFMQKGVRGRSEVFADVFGDLMGGGAVKGVGKFFPNSAKYVEGLLE